ncbi:MAG: peptidylprolyl isomerase [bacterium]|nr:peptidylprolyl isomerase [bacterium]
MKHLRSILTGTLFLALVNTANSVPADNSAWRTEEKSSGCVFMLAQQNIDPEILKLEKAYKADPKDINRQTAYSTAVTQAMQRMQAQGRSDQAIALGERAAALIPQNVTLMHLLGNCLFDRFCYSQDAKDYQKAKNAWERLVKAYPNSPDAMLLLGLKAYENGEYTAALPHFQRAFNARQGDPYTLAFVGMTLTKLNNFQQAAQGYGMAYNKLKTNPAFLASLASAYQSLGQQDLASQRLAEANKYKHPSKPLRTLTDIFPTQAAKTPSSSGIPSAPGTAIPVSQATPSSSSVIPAASANAAKSSIPNPTPNSASAVPTALTSAAHPANTSPAAGPSGSQPVETSPSALSPQKALSPNQTAPQTSLNSQPQTGSKRQELANDQKTAAELKPTPNPNQKTTQEPNPNAANPYRGLVPFPGVTPPPITEVKKVLISTDAGDITVEVYPQAAPNAAKRFLELVESGFYDNTPIFRVVRMPQPFVAQFGINWRPEHKVWQHKYFDDDPSLFQLLPGTLAFAKAGRNINSTQIFINYGNNSFLREQGFTTFARISEGLDKAQQFRSVGNPSTGLPQQSLWEDGESFLKQQTVKPNMIIKMQIVD